MTAHTYHMTRISSNGKTGPIPVSTTSADSCGECGLFRVCYAKTGHLAGHWQQVTRGNRGGSLAEFCAEIKRLPGGQLWRHNQAGELPGTGNDIDADALAAIVRANRGRRGFTFTHKHTTARNIELIADATRRGFVINLSADNAADADRLAAHGLPVAVVIPADAPKVTRTPHGRKVIKCPAESSDRVTCSNCGLCADAARPYVIGFEAKGARKKEADAIARGETTP